MTLKTTKETAKNTVEISIVIDRETFEKAVLGAYKKNVGKISIPGFRKGKAPKGIIERYYGKGVFYEDAINDILPEELDAAIKETGFVAVEMPNVTDVDFDNEEGVLVTATFTRKPDVALTGDYKGFELTKKVVKTEDADVDAELEAVRKRNSRNIEVTDRAAQKGDITDINFEGFVDGKAFEGGKSENHKLTLGSGQFIPGFEEQIEGKNIGEEFDVNVTFPEDYHAEELKGKNAVFKVKLNAITVEELPALDDEFAKDVSEFDTLDEYKADIKSKIEKRNSDDADTRLGNEIAEKLCALVDADIPEAMIETEVSHMVREYDANLRSQGFNLELLMQYTGMKMEDIRARYAPMALANIKKQLALEFVWKNENIVPTAEEIENRYNELAQNFNMKVEEVKERVPEEDIAYDVKQLAAYNVVKDACIVKVESITRAGLEAAEKAESEEAETKAKKPRAKKASAKTDASEEKEPAKKKTTKAAKTDKEENTEEPAEKPARKPRAKKASEEPKAE